MNFLSTSRKSKGFTLIELLVVISIIALLSSVVLASLQVARQKGRDSKRVAEIQQLKTALEGYYADHGTYPIVGTGNGQWSCSYHSSWQTSELATALESFLPTLPVDPVNESTVSYQGGHTYCFLASRNTGYGAAGQWYMLVYTLESQNMQLEMQDGIRSCGSSNWDYQGNDGYVITTGSSCAVN